MENTKVYIEVDFYGNITKIFSTDFEQPSFNSILIDEGQGEKYRHAQTQYLSKPLVDRKGEYNYQYIGGTIIDRGI